jgi:hypothetical protein
VAKLLTTVWTAQLEQERLEIERIEEEQRVHEVHETIMRELKDAQNKKNLAWVLLSLIFVLIAACVLYKYFEAIQKFCVPLLRKIGDGRGIAKIMRTESVGGHEPRDCSGPVTFTIHLKSKG